VVNVLDASAVKPHDPDAGSADTLLAARAALQARITEEIERQGGHPVARRTLGLLVEAAAELQDDPPGYLLRDRAGQPRRIADSADGKTAGEMASDRPMTQADFVAELRTLHPALFISTVAEPAPVTAEAAAPPPAEVVVAPGASSRFVAAQSVRARTAFTHVTTRGRAFTARTIDGWQDLRRRFDARRPEARGIAPVPVPTSRGSAFVREAAGNLRGRVADAGSRLREAGREGGALRNRRVLAAGVGLLALLAVAFLIPRSSEETKPTPATTPQSEAVATAPPTRVETPPSAEEAAKASTALSGPVEVIDTATLRVAGKLVRLFGVEWVRGGQADELTRYLAGRTVTCQPVAGSEARLCDVDGRDLSEVVLFNGGGRASAEATPDLVAAEDRARTERLGVWAR